MKALLSLALVALLALAIGANANAEPPPTAIAALQRRIAWDAQHIRKLEQRRAYLHRFIAELRNPTPVATTSAIASTSYPSSSSGPLRISEAQAAAAMRAAGFPESVIAWFNNGIIQRESGYCPTAVYPGHCGDVSLFVSGGPACSLFQLYTCPGPQVADPYVAARYAYAKYQSSGLSPWGG